MWRELRKTKKYRKKVVRRHKQDMQRELVDDQSAPMSTFTSGVCVLRNHVASEIF